MSTATVSRKGQRGQTGKKIQKMSGRCLGLASQDQKSRDLRGWVSGCSEAGEETARSSDEDDFNRPRPAARGTEKPARGRAWGAQKPRRHRLHPGPQQAPGSWPALRCQAPAGTEAWTGQDGDGGQCKPMSTKAAAGPVDSRHAGPGQKALLREILDETGRLVASESWQSTRLSTVSRRQSSDLTRASGSGSWAPSNKAVGLPGGEKLPRGRCASPRETCPGGRRGSVQPHRDVQEGRGERVCRSW